MCRWRVETGRVKGIGEDNFSSFYLEGRAENTVRNYGGAFRFVWSHAQEIGRSVFESGEGEVAGLMVKIAKEEKGGELYEEIFCCCKHSLQSCWHGRA